MSQLDRSKHTLSEMCRIAEAAGEEILAVYNGAADIEVEQKADDSPLTLADRRAHDLIERELLALAPEIPVLSEESLQLPFAERQRWARYWLVDPLDGTKEFIGRNGEFTVNIAQNPFTSRTSAAMPYARASSMPVSEPDRAESNNWSSARFVAFGSGSAPVDDGATLASITVARHARSVRATRGDDRSGDAKPRGAK